MSKLALTGGKPVRTEPFPPYNTIGEEEKGAVLEVLESGNLSQFIGAWHEDFLGGPRVRTFEEKWCDFFGSSHAISVNSATSGLYAAVGACGAGPGDEVIVSPYTMTASAIAPIIYGAVPVFADIDPDIFCITPDAVKGLITERTRAIIVVHIFGQPADMDGIMELARAHDIRVIEDCAQCPTARYRGKYAGTIGDMGVFSLNYHKHIHTGEGGMIVTDNPELATRARLIRNHGEAAVEGMGRPDLAEITGFNYRMPEIEAAIGVCQLEKLPGLIEKRLKNAEFIARGLDGIEGITPPVVKSDREHVYYSMPFKYRQENFNGVGRDSFVKAVQAELPVTLLRETTPLMSAGYVKPLYMQPLYQANMTPCASNCPRYKGKVSYEQGICPVAERMHFHELFTMEYMRPSMREKEMNDVINAFHKVCENMEELKEWEMKQI
jgi:dTDP-4-amino-4,6-dideoxygalactose transaminase